MTDINQFLDSVLQELSKTQKHKVIVTGNDSADLDSIISSLLFAYFSTCSQKDTLFIPLVKVPRADLELRPELKYVLNQAQVDYKKLICIDQVNLDTPTDIVLIDHNHLTKPFDTPEWSSRVVGVLDHHVDEKLYTDAPLRVVEMVGSCVTLVLDHFKQQRWEDAAITRLALAPLLVDTVNLQWDLGRTTEKDVEVFQLLKQSQGQAFGTTDDIYTDYFKAIEKVKSQVDTMSNLDILRRDYKEFHANGFTIGTSAVTWNLRAWAAREGSSQPIIDAVHQYIQDRQLDMEVIVTAYDYDPDHVRGGDYRRELAIFVKHPKLRVVKENMEKNATVQLSANEALNPTRDPNLEFYDQGNVKMSRKQVWPLLKDFIDPIK